VIKKQTLVRSDGGDARYLLTKNERRLEGVALLVGSVTSNEF
jgi:hypothetical protein